MRDKIKGRVKLILISLNVRMYTSVIISDSATFPSSQYVQDWQGNVRNSNNTTPIKYFFKDIESIEEFAQEPLHKDTWAYYNQHNPAHIGIFHETFIVKDGYESNYVNCHPILLGQSEVKRNSRKDSAEGWMGTLVGADTPGLKSIQSEVG